MPTPQREHTTGIRSLTTAGPGNGHPASVLYAYRGTGRAMTPDQAAAHIAKSRTRLRTQALNVPGREDAGGGAEAPQVVRPRTARGSASAAPAAPAGHLDRARGAGRTSQAIAQLRATVDRLADDLAAVDRRAEQAIVAPSPGETAVAAARKWCDGCDYRVKHCKCPGGPEGGAR